MPPSESLGVFFWRFKMTDFFAALALVAVIEGLLYAAFPEQMKRAMEQMLQTPSSQIRIVAFIFAGVGLVALYFIRLS